MRKNPKQDDAFTLSMGKRENNNFVEYRLLPMGRDWILQITGGETHIGSLALSEGKQIHQITRKQHKETEIVHKAVSALKDLIPGELLVVSGIHYDNIKIEQIREIEKYCGILLIKLQEYLIKQE